jgi:hypothetical protein
VRYWMALTLVVAGCSADDAKDALGIEDEADAAPVAVMVDTEAETIGELTEDEKRAICDDLVRAIDEGVSFKAKCDVVGVIQSARAAADGEAAVRAACREAQEPCAALVATGATGQIPDVPVGECPLFQGETVACVTATADLIACVNQLGQRTADAFASLSCDDLTTDIVLDPPNVRETVESRPDQGPCVAVSTECPGALGTADEPAPEGGAGG